jgi:MOSC domain-containing protein YiiM
MAGRHTERSTLAACIAQVVAAPAFDVPLDADEQRAWLAERGLGLVGVANPQSFAWAGSWVARRPERESGEPRAVVMFGVPSGPIWDPAGTTEEILDGFVVAPLELAAWPPTPAGLIAVGTVEAIVIAPATSGPVRDVRHARAEPDRGLEGDRYFDGRGTFASGRPGSALTLVEAEVLDDLAAQRGGAPIDHRRNVVIRGTDLNALVGRDFTLGAVHCRGRRLCEPCAHLDRLNDGNLLRPMVHRGGLRADILTPGTIHVGDALTPDA